MERLNYHHLFHFWAVAHEGNLTRTAERLQVAQSALSSQIRQLEESLGAPLFAREGRRLVLTEAGRIALRYADDIFSAGQALMATVRDGRHRDEILRLGAVATLSRNFQKTFVKPVLDEGRVRLRLLSGRFDDLIERLQRHELDLVLSNRPVRDDPDGALRCQRVAHQAVSIVGLPRTTPFRFPQDLDGARMVLPAPENDIRTEFDGLCERLNVRPDIIAEVDDMATMRVLANDGEMLALLPSVVVRDELRAGNLAELCVVPDLFETFYAITVERHFEHPWVSILLARDEDALLAMGEARPASRS
jgi:LysR family transcriptional activator of nhaA